MTPLENFFRRLGSQWDDLSSGQRLVFFSMVASFAISVLVFALWIQKPDMSVLASGLDPAVASDVIKELDEKGVEYRIADGGRTVLVDRKMVSELRVLLASSSLLASSPVGYELFDNEKIGITEFAQKINLQRAMEGELSRTISDLRAVDRARVHIAIPKESVFLDDESYPTASVILKLRPGNNLTTQQIQGIANLVSFSIDGLDAANVSIVDDNGNVLKGETTDHDGVSVAVLEEQQGIEKYLSQKAERLLAEVLGSNKAKVAVNAELNWEQVQSTKESYDPAKSAVRSEERNESSSPADGGTTESVITNYELDKTIEHVLSAVGTVKHLSIAAFVDHAASVNDQGAVTHQPRSDEELKSLEDIVKNAVGFDAGRGDNITVVNMRFSGQTPLLEEGGLFSSPILHVLPSLLGKSAAIGMALLLLLAIRKHLKLAATRARQPFAVGTDPASSPPEGVEFAMDPDELGKASMEDQVRTIASRNPENVAKLMKTWMVDKVEA